MKELITYRIAIVAMAIALIFSCSQNKTESYTAAKGGIAASRSCRQSSGHCQYGIIPLFRQSRIHHR